MNANERETTITSTDADDLIVIWTAQKRYIGKLRRHSSYTEINSGHFGGTEWARFSIPAADWNPATGAKRKSGLTADQRAAAASRLRQIRNDAA